MLSFISSVTFSENGLNSHEPVIPTFWNNGKYGRIVDLLDKCCFRFVECESRDYAKPPDKSSPIIASGFVGWLLSVFGTPGRPFLNSADIYDRFLNVKIDKYIEAHKDEPGSTDQSLKEGFYEIYEVFENGLVEKSKALFEFLPECDVVFIERHVEAFFKHVNEKKSNLPQNKNKIHKEILDRLIPKHIINDFMDELKHVLSYGKIDKKRINWKTGHPELHKYLKTLFDDETIPHLHSDNWIDFVLNNFTMKGRPISKKSLQNENTRKDW